MLSSCSLETWAGGDPNPGDLCSMKRMALFLNRDLLLQRRLGCQRLPGLAICCLVILAAIIFLVIVWLPTHSPLPTSSHWPVSAPLPATSAYKTCKLGTGEPQMRPPFLHSCSAALWPGHSCPLAFLRVPLLQEAGLQHALTAEPLSPFPRGHTCAGLLKALARGEGLLLDVDPA